MAGTGGWAKKDGLYCICRNYDLDSERFQLSFLKHEARHYADFGLYPELQPADLEYRSKLTELAYSEEGTYRLLEHFTKAANRVENSPHSLASVWESIPKEQVRQTARRLLEFHDKKLADLGPSTTKGTVNL
jgi:hypothetical protein